MSFYSVVFIHSCVSVSVYWLHSETFTRMCPSKIDFLFCRKEKEVCDLFLENIFIYAAI